MMWYSIKIFQGKRNYIFILMFNCFHKKIDPVMRPQNYKLNNRKYKEETIIAEGGFAYIWKCENFAIKRILIQSQDGYE